MDNQDNLFRTQDLKKFYYTDEIETTALAGVNLTIKKGSL